MKKVCKQKGLTLVELLISLVLSCLLMAAMMQMFVSSKSNYEAIQQVLEAGFEQQQIIELLRDSTRRAGFAPCVGLEHLRVADRRSGKKWVKALSMQQQTLQFSYMSSDFLPVKKMADPFNVLTEGYLDFKVNHPLLIADCFYAEIHNVIHSQKQGTGLAVTLAEALLFPFSDPVYIGNFIDERFYTGLDHKGNAALFYDANHAELLSTHIKELTTSLHKHLLQITLVPDKGDAELLETRVRTP